MTCPVHFGVVIGSMVTPFDGSAATRLIGTATITANRKAHRRCATRLLVGRGPLSPRERPTMRVRDTPP